MTTIGAEADPRAAGLTETGVERIWDATRDFYRSGVHPAIQVCVRRNGMVVLDRSIGHSWGNGPADKWDTEKALATPDTPFCVYSAAKAMTATVVHLLAEHGALSVEDRVCDHIPGYTSHGKHRITIGQVLSHRAGVPFLPSTLLDLDRLDDRDFALRVLCDARPLARPGVLLTYHAISFGLLLGEIVHRVTGKSIRAVLAQEILDPLGFRWTNYGVAGHDVGAVARSYVTGPPVPPPLSTLLAHTLSSSISNTVEISNDPRFLTAVLPSSNTVSTANEMSRFFEMLRLGGELDGVRVLQAQTVRRAVTQRVRLQPDLALLGLPVRYSHGFLLGTKHLSMYGRDTNLVFGHPGFVNIIGWADPERGISGGVITSGKPIFYPEIARFPGLMQRIASEIPKVPSSERAF